MYNLLLVVVHAGDESCQSRNGKKKRKKMRQRRKRERLSIFLFKTPEEENPSSQSLDQALQSAYKGA
jgi:hypothetical protein